MKVTFQGNPLTLEGTQVKVGDTAPDFTVVDNDLNPFKLSDTKGKRVFLTVPSLDTPVCDTEVRRFNQEAAKLGDVTIYTISMDLPFAQGRWCGGAEIDKVKTVSDYKDREFGKNYGVYIKELGLLSRAVFVIDENNKIVYVEYLNEVTEEPDYDKALDLFKRMQYFMETPGILPPKYLDTLPMKGHSITMILINVASRIRQAIQDESFNGQIDASIAQLRKDFMHPEFKALLETVGPHGEFIDSNMGRTINPGHCIETAWFLLEEAKYRNWDKDITELALTILDWSWEWGWDKEFGGIINFKDCKNLPPQDYSQDMKFWWPQTEAIIATLYAYLATGNEKYLDMHKQISDWTYTHFPDKECGEWFGYLHRDGTPAQMAKGNLFKGPFHIPRMMIKGYTLCKEILDNKKSHL